MPTITYNFNNPENYIFDAAKVLIGEGAARTLLESAPQNFVENFNDDTGFVYDAARIVFSLGNMRQRALTPANSTYYASFATSKDGNWGDGSDITGNLLGGAAVTGGFLDLRNLPTAYWEMNDVAGNVNLAQTFAIRLTFKPNYNGLPLGREYLLSGNSVSGSNRIDINIQTSNNIRARIYNSAGALIISNNFSLGAITLVQDQEYELELNVDLTTGATRMFIDGQQIGSTVTTTGTRTSAQVDFRVGVRDNGTEGFNGRIKDLVLFEAVQHTANYTPGEVISPVVFGETVVTLPAMTHPLLGVIHALTNMTVSESNNPQYSVKIGAGSWLYWNGSTWAESDGTYAQSSTLADFVDDIATIPGVSGSTQVQLRVHYPDQGSQGTVDNLVLSYSGNTQYPTDNPTIVPKSSERADALISCSDIKTATGADQVRYAFRNKTTGIDYWWNGTAPAVSSGYAETNTCEEVNAAMPIPLSSDEYVPVIYLHSGDGSSTPEINQLSLVFDFAGPDYTEFEYCEVYGYVRRPEDGSAVVGANVQVTPEDLIEFGDKLIGQLPMSTQTNSEGYFAIKLPRKPGGHIRYNLAIQGGTDDGVDLARVIRVPDSEGVAYSSI